MVLSGSTQLDSSWPTKPARHSNRRGSEVPTAFHWSHRQYCSVTCSGRGQVQQVGQQTRCLYYVLLCSLHKQHHVRNSLCTSTHACMCHQHVPAFPMTSNTLPYLMRAPHQHNHRHACYAAKAQESCLCSTKRCQRDTGTNRAQESKVGLRLETCLVHSSFPAHHTSCLRTGCTETQRHAHLVALGHSSQASCQVAIVWIVTLLLQAALNQHTHHLSALITLQAGRRAGAARHTNVALHQSLRLVRSMNGKEATVQAG